MHCVCVCVWLHVCECVCVTAGNSKGGKKSVFEFLVYELVIYSLSALYILGNILTFHKLPCHFRNNWPVSHAEPTPRPVRFFSMCNGAVLSLSHSLSPSSCLLTDNVSTCRRQEQSHWSVWMIEISPWSSVIQNTLQWNVSGHPAQDTVMCNAI